MYLICTGIYKVTGEKKEFRIFQILLLTYSSEQKAIEYNLLIILNKLCLVHSTDEDEQNFNINL